MELGTQKKDYIVKEEDQRLKIANVENCMNCNTPVIIGSACTACGLCESCG